MKEAIVYAILDSAKEVGMSIHHGYSGRGMYGAMCLGVSGSEGQLARMGAYVARYASQDIADEVIELLANPHKDSMGFDTIFYWRSLPITQEDYIHLRSLYPDPDDEQDEEDEEDEEDDCF